MKWTLLGFVARRVATNLRDLLWTHLLTCGTMAMTLFVFGGFMLLQGNLEQLLRGWGEQIQLTAYLKDPADANALLERLKTYSEVGGLRHISREQAWREFRAALGAQSTLLEGVPQDILPAAVEVTVKPGFRDGPVIDGLAERLRKEPSVSSVEYPQEWVERVALVVLGVRWAKWIFGGLLFLATFFIVGSTVKLAILARKDEIEIMQLVGASEDLIQAPFVMEGMIQGLLGAGLALGGLWGLWWFFRSHLPVTADLIGIFGQFKFLDYAQMGWLLILGVVLGAAGSLFALRRFIRTWKSFAPQS